MSVAYVSSTPRTGQMPYTTSGSSPAAAGNQLYSFAFTNSTSDVITVAGSTSTYANVPVSTLADFGDGHGNTYSLWASMICDGTAGQTVTYSDTATGYLQTGLEFEFSGGISNKTVVYTTTANPSAGGNLVNGQAVTVATGDILVFICVNGDYFGSAPTIVTGGVTASASHANCASWYIAGSGASITPSCSAATDGDTTTPHNMVQFVVSATGSNPPPPPVLPPGPMPRQIYVMP